MDVDTLISSHLHVAEQEASKIKRKVGRQFDYDDLHGEACLVMVRSLPKYDGARPFENFIRRCVHNGLIDAVRKWTRQSRVKLAGEMAFADLRCRECAPGQNMETHESAASMPESILHDDWMGRLVVTLHYREAYSFREMAPMLSMREKDVAQLHQQSLLRLRLNREKPTELIAPAESMCQLSFFDLGVA